MNNEQKLRDYLKRVTNELQLSRQRESQLEKKHGPVVIVGMGCRFPGGVGSPEELWGLVASGGDAVSGFPTNRGWDVVVDPSGERVGASVVGRGGFLYDADGFDAELFGISPREALAMDPQQRLLLEVSWEVFEGAGVDPLSLRGQRVGVFAGAMYHDYASRLGQVPDEVAGLLSTGNAGSVLSGRVAYAFGLEGPAVTVDTACSSSLVALHLAVQALRNGECDLALAGGVTVMATPGAFVEFSRQGGLALDGRCKSFAAAADGVAWGEGVGLLLVERLSDARRNGHDVLAVVRGSAVNQDGASNGLTAPNGPSQQRVITQALTVAGLSPADVDVVEGHGTGTRLGDPIEAQALLATYGQGRPAERPLWLGSVKSNIGHAQAAAGAAGVIKMVLAMRHGMLPRTLHVDEPTPHVDWTTGGVRLLTEATPWPHTNRPPRAAVSSFGISGTNAHVVLEAAPEEPARRTDDSATNATPQKPTGQGEPEPGLVPWVVSAGSLTALREQAGRLAGFVGRRPELGVVDVGWSLVSGRAGLPYRAVVVGRDQAELTAGLRAVAEGVPAGGVVTGSAGSAGLAGLAGGGVAVMFPGQGSQRVGMAVGLARESEVFAGLLRECSDAVEVQAGWSVWDVLHGVQGAPSLDRVDVVQPALFAVMVALAGLWRYYGVDPRAVVGHSQGEIAAACVAGVLSLSDAAKIVVVRSRALRDLAGSGAMVSVALPVEQVTARLQAYEGRASIAAVNGPEAVVVAGPVDVLDAVLVDCDRDGVWAKRIAVDYASHSDQVDSLRSRLVADLADIRPGPARIGFYSTVYGGLVEGERLDAEYWFTNLRRTVRLRDSVEAALHDGHEIFIEVSPHPILVPAVQDTIEQSGLPATAIGTLRRDDGGLDRMLLSLGAAWAGGASVDWGVVFAGTAVCRVPLPTYAFQHRRYWLPAGREADVSGAGLVDAGHPLLGAVVGLAEGGSVEGGVVEGGVLLTGWLSVGSLPWLADHQVLGQVVVPGTAVVEMVLRAGQQVDCAEVRELTLLAPMVLPSTGGLRVQVRVSGSGSVGEREVSVFGQLHSGGSSGGTSWVLHAVGVLGEQVGVVESFDLSVWPPVGAVPVPVDGLYDELAGDGLMYGPAFRGVQALWRADDGVYAEVELPELVTVDGFGVHPALLDAALHPAGLLRAGAGGGRGDVWLPFAWTGVSLQAVGASVLRVAIHAAGDGVMVRTADATGRPVAVIQSLVARPVTAQQLADPATRTADALFTVDWTVLPATPEPADTDTSTWAVLGGDQSLTGSLTGSVTHFTDLPAVSQAVAEGMTPPAVLVLPIPSEQANDEQTSGGLAERVRLVVAGVLQVVQDWLADDRYADSRLLVLTRGAVPAGPVGLVGLVGSVDLVGAAVWGLLRSAQSENPDRFVLVDLDPAGDDARVGGDGVGGAVVGGDGDGVDGAVWWRLLVPLVLSGDEPQLAVRGGVVYVPRLERAVGGLRVPAGGGAWRLGVGEEGTLEGLALLSAGGVDTALGAGEVRIAVRAAGVNFRDVLIGLGMYPGQAVMGAEAAGLVVEVGADVQDLRVGQRVFGLFPGGIGSWAVTDRRLVARVPAGWSWTQAAAVPVVFATAYYGLRDLAGVRAGESVLIHAATGGVGMAAVQLAQHWGLQIFGTTSEGKWPILERCGVRRQRIASSRDLDFEEAFHVATDGRGVDVVLNSLAGDFVDASVRLLATGGRFIEMGKTDIRDRVDRTDVHYQAFDLIDAGPERIQQILTEILALFEQGALQPLPITVWDARDAVAAFRHIAQARHVGKNVLSIPAELDPQGTVLITGGTGALGGLLARHLVTEHGVRHLLLTSRSGLRAAGATQLTSELQQLGAQVNVVACDTADRDTLAVTLTQIPPEHPLTGVVHAAGVLDDGVLSELSPQRVAGVLRPKVDTAINLHELTADMDLAMFVLYSSASATFGTPGQANYAAANAFLDGLATYRRTQGLPAQSLGWGLWQRTSAMTSQLGQADLARVSRVSTALTDEQGIALFDTATETPAAHLLPIVIDVAAIRTTATTTGVPPLLRGLLPASLPRANQQPSSTQLMRLVGLPPTEQKRLILETVWTSVNHVLGGISNNPEHTRTFRELGFDSLTAVELRNRLNTATGLRLPATLVFDYPTPGVLVDFLFGQLLGGVRSGPVAGRVAVAAVDDPVVIVGMGCRFPGGVGSPEELWGLVVSGGDAVSGFPTNRGWDVVVDPSGERVGASVVGRGGFLYDADGFDAELFGISPREALAMDPQQRLLLEVSWEVFEGAGVDPLSLRGQRVGVFAGTSGQDYLGLLRSADAEMVAGYVGTGSAGSVLSGRVAYAFGLEGPAVTVDTACSSSLVALHLAVQALRNGECDLALAGGVTVMATPGAFVEFSRQGGLALDGRCKSFAAAADGVAWGEGVGLLLVERLSDARRNGHDVLAVVRGSAVNQDGASNGLTAPNGPSQQRVITQALTVAGLSPADVDVVEGHGTGTRLGDPIEAQALLATYGQGRPAERPLWLGSVKSNIGHAQAAAGAAGVIKMVLAMRHGMLPRTLHVDEPTPHVDWTTGGVRLLTEATPWPHTNRPPRAAVSSFGISGTNAHVVLEAAPHTTTNNKPEDNNVGGGDSTEGDNNVGLVGSGLVPWVVSAGSMAGLQQQANRLREFVTAAEDAIHSVDVGWSLVSGRAGLPYRAVVVGRDQAELTAGLRAVAEGVPAGGVVTGSAGLAGGGVAVMFPGQGSQRVGMGAGLYRVFPVFTAAFDEVCSQLDGWLPQPLREVMFSQPTTGQAAAGQAAAGQGQAVAGQGGQGLGLLGETVFAQAGLFAVEVALFRLLESWGVRAGVVVGHSVGEVTAAYVAGVLSLPDACVLVAQRGRLMQALPGGGAMVAVRAGVVEVEEDLERYGGRLVVAAVNSPMSVVVSGDSDAVDEYVAWCGRVGRKATRLTVSHAFHSPRMRPMLAEFEEVLAGLSWQPASLPVVSTLTGELVDAQRLGSPEYWVRQAQSPVRFADAVQALRQRGVRILLEVGPDTTLTALATDCLDGDTDISVVPAMRPALQEPASLLTALAHLYVGGAEVDWGVVFAGTAVCRVPLPTYAFQHRRYWLPAGREADVSGAGLVDAGHPLLGAGRIKDGASVVRQRLAEGGSAERENLLRDVVRADVAAVLGHRVDEMEPNRAFTELGLTSISAAELGARLFSATGVRVSPAAVFEHTTVEALARKIAADCLDYVDHPVPSGHPLAALFRQACADGKVEEGIDLLAAAATILRTSSDHPGVGEPVRFTEGASRPVLICVPSLVAPATPMQYARFAAAFRDVRTLSVIVPPGYKATEDLPGCLAAAVHAEVSAARQCAAESPFVLVGYSSGGWLAHAVADELASSGPPPSGVVLLDTYLPNERAMAELLPTLFGELAAKRELAELIDDTKLTAMGCYLRLFREWTPSANTIPTLFVRASDVTVRSTSVHRTPWPAPHVTVDVAGDHLSIMEDQVAATAMAVAEWLADLP